jgi:hypothetical protein
MTQDRVIATATTVVMVESAFCLLASLSLAKRVARPQVPRWCQACAQKGHAGGVLPDSHFAVQLNHFMPGFLSDSVAQ